MDRSASVTVPPCLVELAKRVVRGFYGATSGYGDEMCAVIVDILIRMICVKEEDLVALVGVDKKAVVARLNILCKEHLIAKSEDVDPDAPPPEEGEKEVRVSFYCESTHLRACHVTTANQSDTPFRASVPCAPQQKHRCTCRRYSFAPQPSLLPLPHSSMPLPMCVSLHRGRL
eukprot:m.151577 g.151577  ORF g.151577 m.151577 type:complete len:173 (+) comp14299_c0_seq1:394-912(+)